MNHELIPKQLNLEKLNPLIRLDTIPALIPTQGIIWPKGNKPRYAGVSSFGFTGTNAHIILEEAPVQASYREQVLLPQVFDKQSYWIHAKPKQLQFMNDDGRTHPFLQRQIPIPDENVLYFESVINMHYPEFVADHLIYGYPVIAGAGYISMALSLTEKYFPRRYCQLENIEFIEALVLDPDNSTTAILVKVVKKEDNALIIEIYSKPLQQEKNQLRARLHLVQDQTIDSAFEFNEIRDRFPKTTSYTNQAHFAKAEQFQLQLGSHFNWIEEVYIHEHTVLARMRMPRNQIESDRYVLYPGFIDSCFQSILALVGENDGVLAIPFFIEKFVFEFQSGLPRWIYGIVTSNNSNNLRAEFVFFDENGKIIGQVKGFSAQKAPKSALERSLKRQKISKDLYLIPKWHEISIPEKIEFDNKITVEDLRDEQDALSTATVSVLERIQVLLFNQVNPKSLVILTQGLYSGENPVSGALLGLIKTALIEYPLLGLSIGRYR